jgi:hypothetical protein
MLKVFVIGPTVGLNKLNIETFRKVEKVLVQKGLEPVVPHDLFSDEENERGGLTRQEVIERFEKAIENCDAAITVPGYAEDHYAAIQFIMAGNMGLMRVRLDQVNSIVKKLPCRA